MKWVKKVISILVKIISIARMKLLMVPKQRDLIILLAKWVSELVYIYINKDGNLSTMSTRYMETNVNIGRKTKTTKGGVMN